MTTATLTLPESRARGGLQFGRPLVHPLYDYLLIGGGLSLAAAAFLRFGGLWSAPAVLWSHAAFTTWLPVILLLCNSAHVSAG